MVEIKTLEKTPQEEIFECFKEAFAGYFVSMDQRFHVHQERWKTSGVDFSLSAGAFIGGKLSGFILHVPYDDFIFNMGTGVLPEARGQKLVDRMYGFSLPFIRGFKKAKLEVITENQAAIKVYERIGFQKDRRLLCYKGEIPHFFHDPYPKLQYQVRDVHFSPEMRDLIPYPYSAEQSEGTLVKFPSLYECHELKDDKTLFAYAIFNPRTMGLIQFEFLSADHASSLLSKMKLSGEVIKMNNVDERHGRLISLWESYQLKNYISQYEMSWSIV